MNVTAASLTTSPFTLHTPLALPILPRNLVSSTAITRVSPGRTGLRQRTLSADMKKTITVGAGVPPKNADSTIKRKGSSRPWVDTGAVVGAISYAVLPEGDEGESE